MSGGWIAIHRCIMSHCVYQDKPFCELAAWIDMLLLARWKGEDRGTFETTYRALARRWEWSYSKVYRYLARLEAESQIESKANQDRTTIRITNYDSYQSVIDERESEVNQNRIKIESQSESNKKKDLNNNKNKEEEITFPPRFHERAQSALETWLEYKRDIKDAYKSSKSVSALLRKWANDPDGFCRAVETSMANGWKGLFPADQKNTRGARRTSAQIALDETLEFMRQENEQR